MTAGPLMIALEKGHMPLLQDRGLLVPMELAKALTEIKNWTNLSQSPVSAN